MPEPEDPLDIPVPGEGDEEMPVGDVSENFGSLLQHQLAQSGNVAQNNFITVQKAFDYDFLEGKRIVDLTEALGAREVASKYVPAGPQSGP